jgi:hypothetical protein
MVAARGAIIDKLNFDIEQLRAIVSCDQSDGYLKQWASDQLHNAGNKTTMSVESQKVPSFVA